jgi:alpha-1,2-mannosyltransferase
MRRAGVVYVLIAAYAVAHFLSMRLDWDIYASPIRGTDFSSYYTAGLLVRDGEARSLYDVAPGDSILGDATGGPWAEAGRRVGLERQHYYIYPPLFALLSLSLTFLPYARALDLWLVLDFVFLALALILYTRSRGDAIDPRERALMVVIVFFEFLPLIWAMAVGQTSLMLLCLLAATLLAARRGNDLAAGTWIGIAAAIKLTPALFALYFWWRGRRKIALAAAAVFGATQIVSIAALGWEPHRIFYFDVVPSMAGGTAYFLNQSLAGFFARLLTAGDVRQVELAASPIVRGLATAGGLALLAASAAALRRRPVSPAHEETQFGVVVLLTLILSPISWSHHYVLVLLPLFALSAGLLRRPAYGPALLLALAYLLVARKPHPDLFLTGAARLFNSAALAGALILWGLSMHALRAGQRRGADGIGGAGGTGGAGARGAGGAIA